MKNLRVQIEARLDTLLAAVPQRQRPQLFMGLFFLSILLVWLLLLSPLSLTRSALRKEIGVKEQELAWMRMAAQEVRQYALEAGGAGQGGSFLSVIDSSIRQFNRPVYVPS